MSWAGVAQEMPDSPKIVAGLNKRAYTREFRVQVDSLADGPKTACSAPGIPRLYDPYVFGNESDDYALVRDIDADRMQGASLYWKVTVRYETPEPVNERGNSPSGTQHEQAGQHDNPLAMLPEVQTATEKFQEVVYLVYEDGKLTPCRNQAGYVFDPPPMKDASRIVLSITRNEAISVLHPAVDIIYADAVNSDVWWGCPAGTWKCQGISTQRETKQLSSGAIFPYLRCTYKFEARPSWDTELLNAGPYYLDNAFAPKDDKNKRAFTIQGHPATGLLDISGQRLPEGQDPIYLKFKFYLRRPFGALNLPQSFAQCA